MHFPINSKLINLKRVRNGAVGIGSHTPTPFDIVLREWDLIISLTCLCLKTRNWITGSFVCHQLPRQNLSLCSISNIKLHVTWYLWSCRKKIETDNNWSWIVKNEHYSCLNLVTLMDRGDNWALIDYLYSELSLIFVPVKEMTRRRKMKTVWMMLIGMRWVKVEMTLVLLLLMTFLFIVS